MVKSDTLSSWLKALLQYAHSEGRFQLLILLKQGSTSVDLLQSSTFPINFSGDDLSCDDPSSAGSINVSSYSNAVAEAYSQLCSSIGTLEMAVTTNQAFCFQTWFLSLRAEVLENVMGILKNLRTSPLNLDNSKNFEFMRLSQELDLIGTSFIDMDRESSKCISVLALNCALLAFTVGFTVSITNVHVHVGLTGENTDNFSQALVLQNLVDRLCHIDQQTMKHLDLLLNVIDKPKNCFHLHSRFRSMATCSEDKDFVSACNFSVSGIVCWLNEVSKENDEKTVRHGLQFLSNITVKWLHIPSRNPKYFFKILEYDVTLYLLQLNATLLNCRQCISVQNADARNQSDISVQPEYPSRSTDQVVKGSKCHQDFKLGKIKTVEMNKNFLCYLENCNGPNMRGRKCGRDGNDGIVKAFVNFEPNEKGQGFSRCMLDVSDFPAACYRIKWHSCVIDKRGSYWSILPLNIPVFTIQKSPLA
ncbi:ARM repeat superfamily protein [Quillaja saponaria]|uniref:ARM repeat superfamily protein n=1 Tax=Quillaja saponaria TaxID=32244 RepID=A0AAD7QJQ7_QUISA|nr:ARM repeat superfamily protein [Quillaja saponaria]